MCNIFKNNFKAPLKVSLLKCKWKSSYNSDCKLVCTFMCTRIRFLIVSLLYNGFSWYGNRVLSLFLISVRVVTFRRRQEAEKSESYETWLAKKETEKRTTLIHPIGGPRPVDLDISDKSILAPGVHHDGYLRSYLRSLDERKRTNNYFCFEDWLNQKEETVLGIQRQKTTSAS